MNSTRIKFFGLICNSYIQSSKTKTFKLIIIGFILPFIGYSYPDKPIKESSLIACDPVADSLELVKLYNKFDGLNWINNTNWLEPGKPISEWYGVKVNAEGCVLSISLQDNALNGILYDFNFQNLTYLNLGGNISITGAIPDFSNLSVLDSLDLYSTNLSGTIPDFSNLPVLTYLHLSYNKLIGPIPDFSNIPNLKYLYLDNNGITGTIPNFSNLPKLLDLGLSTNKISGPIPNFLNIPMLFRMAISFNQLTDTIPNFSNIPELNDLGLTNNQLTGKIPDFFNLPKLNEIELSVNQLTGKIPDFFNLPQLTIFKADSNHLSGSIPDFSNLHNLSYLNLSRNTELAGSIPNFSDQPHLTSLDLSKCGLTGSIPEMKIPAIEFLNLSYNQLSGALPNALRYWIKLKNLNLSNNTLTNAIPPDLGDLCLDELNISNNLFIGTFPEELSKIQTLDSGEVDFKDNLLTDSTLSNKFVFYCPYGVDIFKNNNCHSRFKDICSKICSGNEWDTLSKYPFIQNILYSLDCNQNNCTSTSIQAGFVDVRNIKLIFIRIRCYNRNPSDSNEIVKFYDCDNNLIETVICVGNQLCTSSGAITIDTFKVLKFDVRWNCNNEKTGDDSVWLPLECRPNPSRSVSICKVLEQDELKTLVAYNLQGESFDLPFSIQNREIIIDIKNLNPGIYIITINGKLYSYRTKLAVF